MTNVFARPALLLKFALKVGIRDESGKQKPEYQNPIEENRHWVRHKEKGYNKQIIFSDVNGMQEKNKVCKFIIHKHAMTNHELIFSCQAGFVMESLS